MISFKPYLNPLISDFFQEYQSYPLKREKINTLIKNISGINEFFTCQAAADQLLNQLEFCNAMVSEPKRRDYGDHQTNEALTQQITEYILSKEDNFEFVLEPTCGKGNFILTSIKLIKDLKKVVGVEIYEPYIWETKFKILSYFIDEKPITKPDITIIHADAFDFSYQKLADATHHLKTLVIGNPPWVTNAKLGAVASKNIPQKSNFKQHRGVDAITGKGNFDIGEYIALKLLRCFGQHKEVFAFLVKNSVVKNMVQEQKQHRFSIAQMEQLNIDAQREFNASVSASLFFAKLHEKADFKCVEGNFYDKNKLRTFGWYRDKFVAVIEDYERSCVVEGISIFTWRSGIKHDCSKVMELDDTKGELTNKLGVTPTIENDLVYGLLKSSDLKKQRVNSVRKYTIITQKKIGQDTSYIKQQFPQTYAYLYAYKDFFTNRKSSIYQGKPLFSIFGVGDYSFANYKVAISGFYKTTHFTLVAPHKNKPIMLDDTCYFIGFDDLKMATIAHYLLNSELVQQFLQSIIFLDAKRPINKEVLMRIDLQNVFKNTDFKRAQKDIQGLKMAHWDAFSELLKSQQKTVQPSLFETFDQAFN